jgi:NAD(P)-dependent dehydrogenase (short-subunit alcohol dehydrogenase family)
MTDTRTILITGATDGLGRALANGLAAEDAQLILHGRSREKLDRAAAEIAREHGGRAPATALADLADLKQVRDLSYQVAQITDRLDVLVNNAGIGSGEPDGRTRRLSADGYELRFAVNYLAGFDLTLRLLPLLAGSPAARIVNVASIGQHPLDFSDIMLERNYSGARAYGQSKLAQITAGFVLAGRLTAPATTVNSLHPATYMPTKMVLEEIGHSIDTLEEGEVATRRLVSEPSLANTTGRFFDRTRETRANADAYDPDTRGRLWQLSLELTDAPDAPSTGAPS